jgi:predicted transcriptional regulator
MKKRSRTDIYADILEVLKHRPEGALLTKLSYGAGLPIDRIKPMLQTLANFGLLSMSNDSDGRFYHITRRGLEFLDAYRKVQSFMTFLGEESK